MELKIRIAEKNFTLLPCFLLLASSLCRLQPFQAHVCFRSVYLLFCLECSSLDVHKAYSRIPFMSWFKYFFYVNLSLINLSNTHTHVCIHTQTPFYIFLDLFSPQYLLHLTYYTFCLFIVCLPSLELHESRGFCLFTTVSLIPNAVPGYIVPGYSLGFQ